MVMKRLGVVLAVAASAGMVLAQQTARTGPEKDSSVIDAQGTAHVTRVVPVPEYLSPQAQKWVGKKESDVEKPQTVAEQRAGVDAWQARAGAQAKLMYPVNVTAGKIAGVPVRM